MRVLAAITICIALALLLTSCAGGACNGLQNVNRPPIDAGTKPMIVIDAVSPGSGYTNTDPDGCMTGRVFNVDPARVRVRVFENGWPQPWPDSLNKVGSNGIWYCQIRKGETFSVYLLAEEGYLPDLGTPYSDPNIRGNWHKVGRDTRDIY